ncbi:MAG: J domain-containing protein [bacterium]
MINNLLILNLKKGATPAQIKYAYRKLVKKWHPDLFYHDLQLREIAEARLKQINKAYAQLRANNFSEILTAQPQDFSPRQRTKPSQYPHILKEAISLLHSLLYHNKNVLRVCVNILLLMCVVSISFLSIILFCLFITIICTVIL